MIKDKNSLFNLLDMYVDSGKSLRQLEKIAGCSKEYIRQYYIKSGQLDIYKSVRESKLKESKKDKEIRNKNIESLVSGMMQILSQKAQKKSSAHYYAVKFYFSPLTNNKNRSFESLVKLFKIYFDNKNKKKALGFWDIGKRCGMNGSSVRIILNRVGLKSMNWEHKKYSEDIIKALRNSAYSNMTYKDISGFLGLNKSYAYFYLNKHHIKKKQSLPLRNNGFPSYKYISEIYELCDIAGSEQEIKEIYKDNIHIDTILKERPVMEKKIIKQLRILFPDRNITKPYL